MLEQNNQKNIENLIYEIRGMYVMLDNELALTKCHGFIYDSIVMHYDIVLLISMFINFADTSAKLERSQEI